jgi:hypothetical protein
LAYGQHEIGELYGLGRRYARINVLHHDGKQHEAGLKALPESGRLAVRNSGKPAPLKFGYTSRRIAMKHTLNP